MSLVAGFLRVSCPALLLKTSDRHPKNYHGMCAPHCFSELRVSALMLGQARRGIWHVVLSRMNEVM